MNPQLKPPVRVLVIATLIAVSPILSVLIASTIAFLNGCTLNEGASHPCTVLWTDIGELLYTLFVMGWFALITLPIGGGVALVALIWLIVVVVRGRGEQ